MTWKERPGKDRLSPEQALISLQKIEEPLTSTALAGPHTVAAIRRFAGNGVIGGTLYDGWIASGAFKAGVDILHTGNAAHFGLRVEEVAQAVRLAYVGQSFHRDLGLIAQLLNGLMDRFAGRSLAALLRRGGNAAGIFGGAAGHVEQHHDRVGM